MITNILLDNAVAEILQHLGLNDRTVLTEQTIMIRTIIRGAIALAMKEYDNESHLSNEFIRQDILESGVSTTRSRTLQHNQRGDDFDQSEPLVEAKQNSKGFWYGFR